ncbi:MAG: MFS transporter [Planctomycetes bacterium]|nr:MFS transporter [Planctomycetota bacterium]
MPAPPRPTPGWPLLTLAALAMVGTLPARTQGLGLITEPLLTDLALDRVSYASLNLWATILGACGALGIGRLLDRYGPRLVLTCVAATLSLVVAAMSQVTSWFPLAVALTATRAVGQGALSVVSIAIVGLWFRQRIDRAMALYSIALSIGFMMAFPAVGAMVESYGWRAAWLAIAVALGFGLAPLAWILARRGPPTSDSLADEPEARNAEGLSLAEAVRTGAFWVFALGAALYGLVASGIGLFNEAILAELGFGYDIYYQSLAITALFSLVGNFLGGWLTRQVSFVRLMAGALVLLALGVGVLPQLGSLTAVMLWAAAMGISGGIVMVHFFSVWPAVFGRRHLGRIQGAAQALTVLGSAVGPLLLALCVEATGSHAVMFRILALAVALLALAALLVSLPTPQTSESPAEPRTLG